MREIADAMKMVQWFKLKNQNIQKLKIKIYGKSPSWQLLICVGGHICDLLHNTRRAGKEHSKYSCVFL